MSKEEIKDILEELHLVKPEILKPKAKKLFEAIICIADERDILLEQNQKYKEVIDKLTFIKDRERAGATQETINNLAIAFVNNWLKEVE